MGQKSINLIELQKEIQKRKKENNVKSGLSESETISHLPRKDQFLHGLLESLNTGQKTHAIEKIFAISERASQLSGDKPIDKNRGSLIKPTFSEQETVNMSQERDELLFEEFKKKKNFSLTDEMKTYLSEPVRAAQQNQQTINEEYIINTTKIIVDNYLKENFTNIIEETIKGIILDIYASEKIKEVLYESKDLIKRVVIDTIKEIQARKKAQ